MTTRRSPKAPRRALVLSGGGARGAYEAGVLRYILDELPAELGGPAPIDIVTGTSVGAIHACFIAATAERPEGRGEALCDVWQHLRFAELFGSAPAELARLPGRVVRLVRARRSLRGPSPPGRLFGLLNTERLERMLTKLVPWDRIGPNLREGHLHALCVAATEVATGRVVVFVETEGDGTPQWTLDPSVIARPATIGRDHALASAAIPLMFPAVRLGTTYFVDGGLRLNTPLAPALRLGADRVLVVALRQGALAGEEAEIEAQRIEHYGSPLFLLGKVLNALILDHVESDLSHMRLLNDLLRRVELATPEDALAALNDAIAGERGQPYRVVTDLVVRPSKDLGLLAQQVAREDGGMVLRLLLRTLGFGGEQVENDFLSYFYFDSSYTARIMQLGLEDARAVRSELLEFFRD